jgi:fructose-1,6-bisphosphatase/inositol monophosphatase family enzyme
MALPSHTELEAIAVRAGAIALGHFRRVPHGEHREHQEHREVERKPDRSVVTAADREVESFLGGELGPRLPDAGIIGEEGAERVGTGPHLLVIDPIDGTAAFVAGLPTWCVCVGILRDAEPVAGVVHLPCTGETYSACEGRAWWNGSALPAGAASDQPGDKFIAVDGKAHVRRHIRYQGKVRSLGSGAYHVLLAARGVAEAALLGHAHVWDLAAPGAVLYATGGVYEYLDGTPVDLGPLLDGRRAPGEVVAGRPGTLARLRPLLGGA